MRMRLPAPSTARLKWRDLIWFVVMTSLSACSANSWQSHYGRNHPLTGRIWDVASGEFIDRPALIMRLARAEFVLLGEKHDNPDHHRLPAGVPPSVSRCSASMTPVPLRTTWRARHAMPRVWGRR